MLWYIQFRWSRCLFDWTQLNFIKLNRYQLNFIQFNWTQLNFIQSNIIQHNWFVAFATLPPLPDTWHSFVKLWQNVNNKQYASYTLTTIIHNAKYSFPQKSEIPRNIAESAPSIFLGIHEKWIQLCIIHKSTIFLLKTFQLTNGYK